VIDLREEQDENAFDSVRGKTGFVSNEIGQSDLQKHNEQGIRP
jgi:hypothetical protein